MTHLVANDSGYGTYKGFYSQKDHVDGGGFYSFPAITSSPTAIPGGGELSEENVLEDLFINYQGTDYWLGEKAFANRTRTMNLDPNKLTDKSEHIKMLASLGYVHHLTGQDSFKMVTGIPVDQYNQLKNVVANSWMGSFNYTFRGKNLSVSIKKVKPIAQGAGIYYDLALGWKKMLGDGFFNKRVLVFDLGKKTTNIVPMMKGKFLNDMALTVWTGVTELHNNLKSLLLDRFGLTFDQVEIDRVAKQGYCTYKGEQHSITNDLRDAASPVVSKILSEAQARIDLARDVDVAVFASGGACIEPAVDMFGAQLRDYIANIRTVADPLSNVRGYGKLGAFLDSLGQF